ncbi:MAG: RuvX/YqgF family protein, partial [bacterium]
ARAAEADAVVVGVPLGLEGEEARAEVRRVERFATALRRELGVPVHLVDESLSSREAEGLGSARDSHAVAAAVILQRWLDRPRRGREGGAS